MATTPSFNITSVALTTRLIPSDPPIERNDFDSSRTNYSFGITITGDYTTGNTAGKPFTGGNTLFNGINVKSSISTTILNGTSGVKAFTSDGPNQSKCSLTSTQLGSAISSTITGVTISLKDFIFEDATATRTSNLITDGTLGTRIFGDGSASIQCRLIETTSVSLTNGPANVSITTTGLNTVASFISIINALATGVTPPTTTPPTTSTLAAPTNAKAYVVGGVFGFAFYLEWTDPNIGKVDASNNLFYKLTYTDATNLTDTDVPFSFVRDTDISFANKTTAAIRRPQALIQYPVGSSITSFKVQTVLTKNDLSLNDPSGSTSSLTPFTLYDGCGNIMTPTPSIKSIDSKTVLTRPLTSPFKQITPASVINTKSTYLPPGTYEVGNGGTDLYGNNPYLMSNVGSGRAPYFHRWTIKDPVTNKIVAARQSDFSENDASATVSTTASFALSNGTYTFTGFPMIMFPDSLGNMLVNADYSWPVVVLQDFSNNGNNPVRITAGTDITRRIDKWFTNPKTKTLTKTPGIGIIDNSAGYFSFFDASINNTNATLFNPAGYSATTASVLVQGLGAVKSDGDLKTYNMKELFNADTSNNTAASVCEDISATSITANGFISLYPKNNAFYTDISKNSKAGSRAGLITNISGGLTLVQNISGGTLAAKSTANKLALFGGRTTADQGSVTINISGDFSNNKIHFWDAVWGWQTQGHDMFTYQPRIDISAQLQTTDLCGTSINALIAASTTTGRIDLSNVFTTAFANITGGVAALSAGTTSQISANQQAIFKSLASKVNFGTINTSVTVPTSMFPLNDTLSQLINKPSSTINTVRLLNAGTAAATGQTSKISVFSLTSLVPGQMICINMDTTGDSITLTALTSELKITLNTTKSVTAATGAANQYTVTSDAISITNPSPLNTNGAGNNVFTVAGSNAVDGSTILFKGVTIVLGTVDIFGNVIADGASGIICFNRGTRILTPEGYKLIEDLRNGDLISSTKNVKEGVPIKSLIRFTSKKEDGALYCLPKDSLKKNKPMNDLFMSGDHAFKFNGLWKHMNCASGDKFPGSRAKKYTYETDKDDIEYYHIIIDDYFAHTIVAEGVEVETCFEDKDNGVLVMWSCDEKCCTPLKCDKSDITPNVEKPKTFLNLVKGGEKKKKSVMVWKYNQKLNRSLPLLCNEIVLPN
jgi:hypothetical protein